MSFGRRIGAKLLAEGLEKRADLAMVMALGVDFGQGYLLGRPSEVPAAPRPMDGLRVGARPSSAGHSARSALVQRRRLATSD